MKWPNKRRRLGFLLAFGNISLLTEIVMGDFLVAYYTPAPISYIYGGSPAGYILLFLPYLAVSTACLLLAYYFATKKDIKPAIRTGAVTVFTLLYLCIALMAVRNSLTIIMG